MKILNVMKNKMYRNVNLMHIFTCKMYRKVLDVYVKNYELSVINENIVLHEVVPASAKN